MLFRSTISDEYDEKRHTYRLHVSQSTPPTADQLEKVNLHIPLKVALYGQDGKKINLQHELLTVSDVLDVIHEHQTFEFHNVQQRPVPALLCDFSAPVRLDYDYSTEQLLTLLKFAENDFVRWDVAQMLFNNELRENLSRYQQGEAMAFSQGLLEALTFVIDNANKDPELAALALTLPKETEFAELFKVIDPTGIAAVRHFMQQAIADELKDRFLVVYNQNKLTEYRVVAEDLAKRALRNVCLSYLAFTEVGNTLVHKHYHQANNMTDTLAALSASTKAQLACRDQLLADFEQKWQHDGLVMDKWFALQATRPDENVLEIVQNLLTHPSFNFKNPNRVRSLVGAFASQNPSAFHAIDGSGYRFLVDMLIKMNESNPQVAARLIEPLIKLARYDTQRQTLMRRGLERLKGLDNLARDLFEIIEKALQ